jgi:hypothetical protein
MDVYGDPLVVRSPEGKCYFVRVLPAGFGSAPLVPGGFGLSGLAFALGWVFSRAWRVEVREGEAASRPDGLLSAPLVGIAAKTRGKRAAAAEASKAADEIAQHGWLTGARRPPSAPRLACHCRDENVTASVSVVTSTTGAQTAICT